jgi:hypothetical protein
VVNTINSNAILSMQKKDSERNTVLTDCIFRAHEIERSIYFCLSYYVDETEDENILKYSHNELMYTNYYYDHALVSFYSVFEKLAKFLLLKYDFDHKYTDEKSVKKMDMEKIIKSFEDREIANTIVERYCDCVNGKDFVEYESQRNKFYHCIREYYYIYRDDLNFRNYMFGQIDQINRIMSSITELFSMIITEEKDIYIELERRIKNK